MTTLTVTKENEHFYQINERDGRDLNVDCYLIIGSRKACLIDTLQENTGLYDKVRELTDLPLFVLITHGHLDHAGKGMRAFVEHQIPVGMDHRDDEYLKDAGVDDLKNQIFELHDGDTFDLGGIVLETISCAGHTAGSVVFVDYSHQEMFSGDAIGSGSFWMQLPGCLPLHEFLQEEERLLALTESLENLKIYPGHRYQSPVQLTLQYLRDTVDLTRELIDGTAAGKEGSMEWHGTHLSYRIASKGMMKEFWYDPSKL